VSDAKPITLTIAALGGQGGGVVADWLIDVARRSGFPTAVGPFSR